MAAFLRLFEIAAVAQTYTVLHHFSERSEVVPRPLVACGTTLFGTTGRGGSYGAGTVFKIQMCGTGYEVLRTFSSPDSLVPIGALILSGPTLYGNSMQGGGFGVGTVFRLNTNGTDYTVLAHFQGSANGMYPEGSLLMAGTNVYGTTVRGGVFDAGALFRLNTAGSGYTVLKSFGDSTGGWPEGRLAFDGAALYGATTMAMGTLYKINTDATECTALKKFTGRDGDTPFSGLVLSGSTLYGTTYWGGADWNGSYSGSGTVFAVQTDGSGWRVLKSFSTPEGKGPFAGVIVAGTKLYGTTRFGGAFGKGTVFQLSTDGSGYCVLKHFAGVDGAEPQAELTLCGGTLYGGTARGGLNQAGVLFSLSIGAPSILAPLLSQTAEAGSTVEIRARVSGAEPLFYQWFFNGNPLAGCTNPVLPLPGVAATNSGSYSVGVSNLFGALTSDPAMLSVISLVERRMVPGILVSGPVSNSLLNIEHALEVEAPDWTSFPSVYFTNSPQFFFDLSEPLAGQRYYRASSPGVSPELDLHMVPALTLRGPVGSTVRVDFINQYGPVDAWGTLATVRLVDPVQVFTDTSALGQPPRRWRLVPIP